MSLDTVRDETSRLTSRLTSRRCEAPKTTLQDAFTVTTRLLDPTTEQPRPDATTVHIHTCCRPRPLRPDRGLVPRIVAMSDRLLLYHNPG